MTLTFHLKGQGHVLLPIDESHGYILFNKSDCVGVHIKINTRNNLQDILTLVYMCYYP